MVFRPASVNMTTKSVCWSVGVRVIVSELRVKGKNCFHIACSSRGVRLTPEGETARDGGEGGEKEKCTSQIRPNSRFSIICSLLCKNIGIS